MSDETIRETIECPMCGEKISAKAKKCRFCGEIIDPVLQKLEKMEKERVEKVNVVYGETADVNLVISPEAKKRVTYILLGIFLGGLGIHNFYAGYSGRGCAQLLITLLAGWLIVPFVGVWIWVIIEICTIDRDASGKKMQ